MAEPSQRKRVYRRATFWLALSIPTLCLLYAALMYTTLPRTHGEEVRLKDFVEAMTDDERQDIESAVLLSDDARVFFVMDGEPYWTALPPSPEYLALFLAQAIEQDLPLDIDQQELRLLLQPLSTLVPALIIVAAFLLIFLLLRSGSANTFLKSSARRGATDRPITFDDVAGLDDAIVEVRDVRDYLMAPERFLAMGAEPPRGILLAGPPGTGKTLLARAVAGEAGVQFFSVSGTDFVEMFVGVGAARVRDLFKQVREAAPAILFVDELDAIGRTRVQSSASGNEERDQTLNQLLVELDGFQRETGIVLIGATNRPDVLDPALLRRGRFDRQILVDRPDRAGREAILRVHARGKRLDPRVDLTKLAAATPGFTGADLASVLNEAALLAARDGRPFITEAEVERAVDRTVSGSEGRVRVLSPDERWTVAVHEAGHAVTAWSLPGTAPITRVSIMSRTGALGATMPVADDRQVVNRTALQHELAVLLGGRAAEELVLGESTSAARDDLRRATTIARKMVCEYGMSDRLGRRALGVPASGGFLGPDRLDPDYSGETASAVDAEIARLLDEAFADATVALERNRTALERTATALIQRETLREPDLLPLAADVVPIRDGRDAVPEPT